MDKLFLGPSGPSKEMLGRYGAVTLPGTAFKRGIGVLAEPQAVRGANRCTPAARRQLPV